MIMPGNGPSTWSRVDGCSSSSSWIGEKTVKATSEPIMKNSPWAKFGMFITPNTRASPPAMSAHMPPVDEGVHEDRGLTERDDDHHEDGDADHDPGERHEAPGSSGTCGAWSRWSWLSLRSPGTLPGRGVAEQLLARPLEHDLPLLEDVRPVDEAEGRVHVLLDEQDRHAALCSALERLECRERRPSGPARVRARPPGAERATASGRGRSRASSARRR